VVGLRPFQLVEFLQHRVVADVAAAAAARRTRDAAPAVKTDVVDVAAAAEAMLPYYRNSAQGRLCQDLRRNLQKCQGAADRNVQQMRGAKGASSTSASRQTCNRDSFPSHPHRRLPSGLLNVRIPCRGGLSRGGEAGRAPASGRSSAVVADGTRATDPKKIGIGAWNSDRTMKSPCGLRPL
jgi:hypothetical protein